MRAAPTNFNQFRTERNTDELERELEELTAERDLFEAVIQSLDEAVLVIDAQRRVIAVNHSARELLEIDAPIRGRLSLAAIRIPQLSDTLDQLLFGESDTAELELDCAGSTRHLVVRASPRGKAGGVVLVMHDVTEIRRLETSRRDFVANVSHELRAPVSIIQANTETLLSGALDEPAQARRFLDAVRRNAERLGRLISDLLDISRIDAGKYQIEMRALSVGSVAHSVSKSVTEACRRREVVLEIDAPAEVRVRADPRALEQVLVNLVDNAIKYGPQAGRVGLVAREQQDGMVRIEVRDDGPGIAPDHRGLVFERFYRVDPGSRQTGGTGLGLAIVKNLASACASLSRRVRPCDARDPSSLVSSILSATLRSSSGS